MTRDSGTEGLVFDAVDAVLMIEASGELEDPEGARWIAGPVPFLLDGSPTDAARRGTYLYPRVMNVLYGSPGAVVRWHREDFGGDSWLHGADVIAAELITVPPCVRTDSAILLLHLRLECNDPLGTLSRGIDLTGDDEHPLRARVNELLEDVTLAVTEGARRATSMSLVKLAAVPSSIPGAIAEENSLDVLLWLFASATPFDRYRPDPAASLPNRTALSATWRALVLRDGVGFIGLRPSDEQAVAK